MGEKTSWESAKFDGRYAPLMISKKSGMFRGNLVLTEEKFFEGWQVGRTVRP